MTNQNQEVEPTKQDRQPIWKLILALVLGVGLLYFAFRGIDFEKMMQYMKEVNPLYVCIIFVVGVVSHVLRAVRWVILLKPVAERNVSLWNSFYAVIMGYAINVVIPKGGEVARIVEISRLEKIPWAGVAPTLVIDRLLDVVLLAFLVGTTLTVLPQSVLDQFPGLAQSGVAMVIGAVVGLLLLPKLSAIIRFFIAIPTFKKLIPERILGVLESKIDEFDKGTKCLNNPMNYPIIAVLSVLMWACYVGNFYLMILAFNLQDKVSPINSLIAFTIGTLANFVPTPGSAGGFHVLVQQGMMMTTDVNKEQALAVATLLHIMAYVVVSCIPAAFCVLVQSFKKKAA